MDEYIDKIPGNRRCPLLYGRSSPKMTPILSTDIRQIFLNVCMGKINSIYPGIYGDFTRMTLKSRIFPSYTQQDYENRRDFRNFYIPYNIMIIDAYIISYIIDNEMFEVLINILDSEPTSHVKIHIVRVYNDTSRISITYDDEKSMYLTSGTDYYSYEKIESITEEISKTGRFTRTSPNVNEDIFVIDNKWRRRVK